jgi:hypothetical protein
MPAKKSLACQEEASASSRGIGLGFTTPPIDKLVCIKCQILTTVSGSQAAGGRNPFRRCCNDCSATDKWYQRQLEIIKPDFKGKPKGVLSAEGAKNLRDTVLAMDFEERVGWYKAEKEKRCGEQKAGKRAFADSKAFMKQEDLSGVITDENDTYQTFEIWASMQIQLGRCKEEKGAEVLWKAALAAHGAQVIERRGVKLLGTFTGVNAKKRESSMLSHGMKAAACLDDKDDVEETSEADR